MSKFKKRYNISQKELNSLAKRGIVEIQQGGFIGDNLHHDKVVVIRDLHSLGLYLEREPETEKGKRKRRFIWTETEIRFLKENYKTKTDSELAHSLRRTKCAVTNKRQKLGLQRTWDASKYFEDRRKRLNIKNS